MFLVVREYQDGPVQYWRLESASPALSVCPTVILGV